jgi:hypothetical protein
MGHAWVNGARIYLGNVNIQHHAENDSLVDGLVPRLGSTSNIQDLACACGGRVNERKRVLKAPRKSNWHDEVTNLPALNGAGTSLLKVGIGPCQSDLPLSLALLLCARRRRIPNLSVGCFAESKDWAFTGKASSAWC